jgi:hypothetical protein
VNAKRLKPGKFLNTIVQHPLASQELLGLLKSIGSLQTSSETRTLVRLSAAYGEMGKQFPSPELEADLAALYSNSLGVADAIQPALAALVTKHSSLALEAQGVGYPHLDPGYPRELCHRMVEGIPAGQH